MIRNKYMKISALIIATIAINSMLIGCTNNKSNESDSTVTAENQESDNNSEAQNEQNKVEMNFAKVTAIDGKKLTVQLLENNMPSGGGGKPQGGQGEEGKSKLADKENPPEKPSGEAVNNGQEPPADMTNGQPPSGEKPKEGQEPPADGGAGAGKGMAPQGNIEDMFKETGEEKTIEIGDSVTISSGRDQEQSEASINDITVGSILNIKYDESGNVTGIEIMNNNSGDSNTTK